MKVFTALLTLAAITVTCTNSAGAAAGRYTDARICRSYGFAPHTRAFSACLLNVRHYWSGRALRRLELRHRAQAVL